MKKGILSIAAAILMLSGCSGQKDTQAVIGDGTVTSICTEDVDYDTYFTPDRLRINMVFAGNSEKQEFFLSDIYKECAWAGSPNSLIDKLGYGQYFFEVFSGDKLIFSRGFSTLFEEWRTTDQARHVDMAANQCVWMPCPKEKVTVVFYYRIRKTGLFEKAASFEIDPNDTHIIPGPVNDYNVVPLQVKGDMAHKVDLVFSGEAYTKDQMGKLNKDANKFMEYLFSMEPYKSHRDDFNVWLIESVSEEGGVDKPQFGEWRNTAFNSGFDTFYEDRYLTIQDHRKIGDVYSGAPFDAIFVIANETKYGGGGIFYSYAMGTADNELSNEVFIHEFGHSFAGLGDEYYKSPVAYEGYYPLDVEPWEPNITTLVDFESKWADMVDESTPVPTTDSTLNVVGLYEGAGYMAKDIYRPFWECRMINNTAPAFCPVCQRAISRMIEYYTK